MMKALPLRPRNVADIEGIVSTPDPKLDWVRRAALSACCLSLSCGPSGTGAPAVEPLPKTSSVGASGRVETASTTSALGGSPVTPPARSQAPLAGSAWDTDFPTKAQCRIVDDITFGDLEFELRTRVDARPSMNLQQGRVTLWLGMADNSPQYGSRTRGLVQVESGDLTLRGIVGEWDVRVLLKTPVKAMDRFIADTETDRWVLDVSEDWVSVSLDFHQLMSTSQEVKCADLSLRRRGSDVRTLLAPSTQTDVVVREDAPLHTDEGTFKVDVQQSFGSSEPVGPVANLHGALTPKGQLASLLTCGGLLYGYVAPSDILGQRRVGWGSSGRCPNVGSHVFAGNGSAQPTHRCKNELAIHLATGTLVDRVGTLAAGGTLHIVRPLDDEWTIVSPTLSPVELIDSTAFVARREQLAQCDALP